MIDRPADLPSMKKPVGSPFGPEAPVLADTAHTAAGRRSSRWMAAAKSSSGLCAAFGIGLLICLWILTGLTLMAQREELLVTTVRHNLDLTQLLEEQTRRILSSIEQAHLKLANAYRSGALKPGDYEQYAYQTGLDASVLVQLSLVGPDGVFIGSNLDPDGSRANQTRLADREHIRIHIETPVIPGAEPSLFIGQAVLGKVSRRWTIQTSRPILDKQGRLQAISVASLDPIYFESVYRSLSPGRYGSVSLVGRDLGLRAHVVGGTGVGVATSIRRFSDLPRMPNGSTGHVRAISPIDGLERLVVFRQVEQHDLYVVVSAAVDELLGQWRGLRNRLLALCGLLSAVIIGLTLWLVRRLQQQEQTHVALARSLSNARESQDTAHRTLVLVCEHQRTPLTHARSLAEQIESRSDLPLLRDQARQTRACIEALQSTSFQATDLALALSGRLPLRIEPAQLDPLVRHTVTLLMKPACSTPIHVRFDPALPNELRCDPMRLRQILRILVTNALRFAEGLPIDISVESSHGLVEFHVRDRGPGIPADQQAALFDPGPADTHRPLADEDRRNAGLGLALARALARHMGGDLIVQSEPGRGSRFCLFLPTDQTDV